MSVKHRAHAPLLYDSDVQRTFVRWFGAVTADHPDLLVNHEDVLSHQRALIDTARTHCQTQGLAVDNRAKVSTRTNRPALPRSPGNFRCAARLVEICANRSDMREKDAPKPVLAQVCTVTSKSDFVE